MVKNSYNSVDNLHRQVNKKKRPKKAKIKGQKLCFRSVDMILSKYGPKKRKSEPKKKAVDTVDKKRPKKAKINR